jgi:hypothetical protein
MTTTSLQSNITIAVYRNHFDAVNAIDQLRKAGYDMTKLSIIGKDYETREDVVGYYTTGDRVKRWGTVGAVWGGIWGLLLGAALFIVPGVGPVLVGGPVVAAIVGAIETAVVVGGFSAIGAGLYSMGIPKNSVLAYEAAIKAGKYVVVAHGTEAEVTRARELLQAGDAEVTDQHAA